MSIITFFFSLCDVWFLIELILKQTLNIYKPFQASLEIIILAVHYELLPLVALFPHLHEIYWIAHSRMLA